MRKIVFALLLSLAAAAPHNARGQEPQQELKAGVMCPDFMFLDDKSQMMLLSNFDGKYIYIDVWATWCEPCKDEIPHLEKMREQFAGDNIVFLGICTDKGTNRQGWQRFLSDNRMQGPQWTLSSADGFMPAFGITTVPRFILIGPDGKIIDPDMTRPSDPATATSLRRLLDEAPGRVGGIEFQELTLDKALKAAQKDGKLIFIDAFTSWCAPCREMGRTVLADQEVGSFMNQNFTCLKIDMEQGEGPKIAARYEVDAYPTYMLVRPDGELQYRFTGTTRDAAEFLERMRTGMAKTDAELSAAQRYKRGDRDVPTVRKYIEQLLSQDVSRAKKVCKSVLKPLSDDDKTSADYWFIFADPRLTDYGSANFGYLLANSGQFRSSVGRGRVDATLTAVFEQRLTDIVGRRDRDATVKDVDRVLQEIVESQIEQAEALTGYAALGVAVISKDYGQMMAGLERLAPQWSDKQLNGRFFSVATQIAMSGSQAEKTRLWMLVAQLLQRDDLVSSRQSLESFRDQTLTRL